MTVLPVADPAPVRLADGRRLLTLRGGAAPPAILFDAGAFGIYADGANLVRALAGRGVPAVSYTRANLSGSDPASGPPTLEAHGADMLALLDALGQTGAVVLAGHSMAGLRLHALAERHPDRVAGLVLIDAMVPGAWPRAALRTLAGALRPVERALPALCRTANAYPNAMRLKGRERADKLASVYAADHLRASRAEILHAARTHIAPAAHVPTFLLPAGRIARGSADLARRTGARLIDMSAYGHAGVLAPEPAQHIAEAAMSLLSDQDAARPELRG